MFARRVLGVEVGPARLTALTVARRRPHAILGAGLHPMATPVVGLGPLAVGLGARGRPVRLVLRGPGHLHRIQMLPPMSADDRQAYLTRELRREHEGSEWAFAHAVVGRLQEADGPRDEVLVVAIPRREVDRVMAAAEVTRARIALITTTPLALLRAALALVPPEADEAVAVALWSAAGLTIAVGAGQTLALARELPHSAGVDPLERCATEIQRSLLAFRQQSRGRSVARVLVASALPELTAALPALSERLGVPVEDLNAAFAALLPPEASVGEAAEFLLAYGAALTPPGHGLNLVPESIVLRRRAGALAVAAVILAVLVAGMIGATYRSRVRQAHALERALVELGSERQRLLAQRAAGEEASRERQLYRQRLRALKGLAPGLPALPAALTELARLAPGNLRLQRVTLVGEGGLARLGLAGVAEAPDLADAQAAVSAFYSALRASPLFDGVTLVPAKGERERPAGPSASKRLPFELALVVRTLE